MQSEQRIFKRIQIRKSIVCDKNKNVSIQYFFVYVMMSNKNITKSNCFIFHDVGVKTINNFVIIRNIKFCDDSVGIIDTYISEKYDNVIEKNAVVHGKKIKHGDLLIEFLSCLLYTSPSPRDS